MESLVEIVCHVDDFCQGFLPIWQSQLLASGAIQRQSPRSLCMSEIMTILIAFHQSHYRNFKALFDRKLDHIAWPTSVRPAFSGAEPGLVICPPGDQRPDGDRGLVALRSA